MSDRPNRRGSRSGGPTRTQSDLADVVELLLDKGIVINADIAVSIGDAELLGIQLRAAIASFETAAKYGLEFPTGTDTDRIEEIAGANPIEGEDGAEGDEDDGIDRSQMGKQFMGLHEPPISESSPAMKSAPISGPQDGGESERGEGEDSAEGDDGESGGLSEAIADEDDTYDTGSEPGVRERPTAPDPAEENEDDPESGNESDEASADTEADAAIETEESETEADSSEEEGIEEGEENAESNDEEDEQ